MEGSYVYKAGKIHKVPADEKEALSSSKYVYTSVCTVCTLNRTFLENDFAQ